MNIRSTQVAVLGIAVHLAPITARAQPVSGPFDGDWSVRITCPSNTEESGAKGYSYEFPARVQNGVLSGSHGTEGAAGSLKIDGNIPPDGNAELRARGRTGNPDYAVNKPSSGTAYTYRIRAQFAGGSGSGTRLEARVCNFTFTKK